MLGVISANNFIVTSVVGVANSGSAVARAALRKNGGAASTNSQTSGTSTENSTKDITFGYIDLYNSSGSIDVASFGAMDFAEIIIYNSALSDSDRSAVEGYLMSKWGIQ